MELARCSKDCSKSSQHRKLLSYLLSRCFRFVFLPFVVAALPQICWGNRFRRDARNKTCKVTVDGTDYSIYEPIPFSTKWFSHKFNGPGLRYEIGVCIQTGDIVWTHGPFPCGEWSDLRMFWSRLINRLLPGEMVEADKGHIGEPHKVRTPRDHVSQSDKRAKDRARSRHETVNRRLKQWGCLAETYRHACQTHKVLFAAAAVCTQVASRAASHPFRVTVRN